MFDTGNLLASQRQHWSVVDSLLLAYVGTAGSIAYNVRDSANALLLRATNAQPSSASSLDLRVYFRERAAHQMLSESARQLCAYACISCCAGKCTAASAITASAAFLPRVGDIGTDAAVWQAQLPLAATMAFASAKDQTQNRMCTCKCAMLSALASPRWPLQLLADSEPGRTVTVAVRPATGEDTARVALLARIEVLQGQRSHAQRCTWRMSVDHDINNDGRTGLFFSFDSATEAEPVHASLSMGVVRKSALDEFCEAARIWASDSTHTFTSGEHSVRVGPSHFSFDGVGWGWPECFGDEVLAEVNCVGDTELYVFALVESAGAF